MYYHRRLAEKFAGSALCLQFCTTVFSVEKEKTICKEKRKKWVGGSRDHQVIPVISESKPRQQR